MIIFLEPFVPCKLLNCQYKSLHESLDSVPVVFLKSSLQKISLSTLQVS